MATGRSRESCLEVYVPSTAKRLRTNSPTDNIEEGGGGGELAAARFPYGFWRVAWRWGTAFRLGWVGAIRLDEGRGRSFCSGSRRFLCSAAGDFAVGHGGQLWGGSRFVAFGWVAAGR